MTAILKPSKCIVLQHGLSSNRRNGWYAGYALQASNLGPNLETWHGPLELGRHPHIESWVGVPRDRHATPATPKDGASISASSDPAYWNDAYPFAKQSTMSTGDRA